ncbi:hypothetical protein HAX54_031106, partial [Datura stramonium]|nr:hypothetical protein [Datura stramonium]
KSWTASSMSGQRFSWTASQRNVASAEVSAANNTGSLPLQTRMQTRNGARTKV